MNGKKQWWNYSIALIAFAAILFWAKSISILTEKPKNSEVSPITPAKNNEVKTKLTTAKKEAIKRIGKATREANKVVALGLKKIGKPYVFGGTSEKGFDCSGFVFFVFDKAGVKVPRSSELLAKSGKPVPRKTARRGDIVIFTGTNSNIRKPGHVGIVISKPGEKLSFVHASSYGGVKISDVDGTNYDRRFLEIRRVL